MHPSLQGREAVELVPGVDLGPRRQQHPADLRVAFARRDVQRSEGLLRGHGAGHRPQQVPDPPHMTAAGRCEDVVAASGGHGPPREGTGGRATEATTETQKIVEHVECFVFFFESTTKSIDVY